MNFGAPKIEVNRTVSIQHCLAMHEETGNLASPKYVEVAAYILTLCLNLDSGKICSTGFRL